MNDSIQIFSRAGIVIIMRNFIGSAITGLGYCSFLAAVLAGCAAEGDKVGDGSGVVPDEIETSTPPATTTASPGTKQPEAKTITGTMLNPLKEETVQITYTQGSHQGKTVNMVTKAAAGGAGTWQQITQGIRSMTLTNTDGQLMLLGEEDVSENVAITYAPPIVLLPAKVTAGHKHQGTSKMTVKNLKTGAHRDSGPCNYTVELLGVQQITTPAGKFEAYVFRTVRQIDLSLAKVKVTIITAHVPERGIIMTRVEQNTRALGFISMNKKEEWQLAK